MHAEISALKNALHQNKDVAGATIFVSGYTHGGNRPVSCRPCGPCIKILKEYRVSTVVYRIPEGYAVAKLSDIDDSVPVCPSCDQYSHY